MPRVSARAPPPVESPPSSSIPQTVAQSDPLTQLRTHWKWAAFSQFFFTFNHLFSMNDVSLNAIEEDLIHETNVVLPRIMHRLLYTVSYDRKVTLDNWQTALRKQYRKRDPAANPIGPEPRVDEPEQASSPPPEEKEVPAEDQKQENDRQGTDEIKIGSNGETDEDVPDSTRASTIERGFSLGASVKGLSVQPSEIDSIQMKPLDEHEESQNWLELPMLTKLDSMHLLTEWQFQNVSRLRIFMRDDDENALWRIEPIGYDSKTNAYWLIGADRLWIQRALPKPPRSKATSSLKRKRIAKSTPKGKDKVTPAPAPAAKRPRIQEPVVTAGRSRAAKSQAKAKLDAQAKELAELNRQARSNAGLRTSSRGSPKKPPPPKTTGTRVSKRLRGNVDEDEWQAVPEEWLNEGQGSSKPSRVTGRRGAAAAAKTGLEDGASEISELTELTEEDGKGKDEEDQDQDQDEEGEGEDKGEDEHQDQTEEQLVKEEVRAVPEVPATPVDDRGLEPQPVLPEGFIEWETICVTLYEWEHVAERFENATHYTEKALYKVLVNTIVPIVTEELREIQRKEKLSTAMTQRKRSSRLLLRQSEKEEAEAAERKRREELERNSRARRQEARAKKEEDERERREMAREIRRREREEKERANSEKSDALDGQVTPADFEMQIDVVGNGNGHESSTRKQHAKPTRQDAEASSSQNGRGRHRTGESGSKTPVGEEWELDCEICHRRGINADDGTPMMSCGSCSKWQHIACHDRADQQAGLKRRNWNVVEFFCAQCRAKRLRVPPRAPHPQHMPIPQAHAQQNPYMNLAAQYTSSNYAPYGSVNGNTSYSREPQMSDARSGAPLRPIPHGQPHQQHASYGSPLTFSHYQPQQRGFSSSSDSMYGPSSHTQPYGYTSSQSTYPQYPTMNGGGQHYQARWNASTSSQRSTSEQRPMAVAPPHYNANGDRGLPGLPPAVSNHWQQPPPPHHLPPATVTQQNGPSSFRHHNSSYAPGPP